MRLRKASILWKTIVFTTIALFILTIFLVQALRVKNTLAASLKLPEPTELLKLTKNYDMPVVKGLHINPKNPLKINFILDKGSVSDLNSKQVSLLLNYFFAAVTVPQEDLWVNLSPYEEERVIDDSFAMTDMGKDMLAQDYILKQLASSLTHPETQSGKAYWDVAQTEGLSNFDKVWITPGEVQVFEHKTTAYINKAKFVLQTETDYLAHKKNHLSNNAESTLKTILPELSKEVNNGKHFAQLRQIYHSIILGLWFKERFKNTFYSDYIGKSKIKGIEIDDTESKDKLYDLYVDAFKKGVYDFVRKDESTNRKKRYFSGGINSSSININDKLEIIDLAAMENYIEQIDVSATVEIAIKKTSRLVKNEKDNGVYELELSELDNDSLFVELLQTTDHILNEFIEDGNTGYLFYAYRYVIMELLKNAVSYGNRNAKIEILINRDNMSLQINNRVAKDSKDRFSKAQMMQYKLSGMGVAVDNLQKWFGLDYSRKQHGEIMQTKVFVGQYKQLNQVEASKIIKQNMNAFVENKADSFVDKFAQARYKDFLASDLSSSFDMKKELSGEREVRKSLKHRVYEQTEKWISPKLEILSNTPGSLGGFEHYLIKKIMGLEFYDKIRGYASEEAIQSSSLNFDTMKKTASIALLTTTMIFNTLLANGLNKGFEFGDVDQHYSVVYDRMDTTSIAQNLMYDQTLSYELGASVTIDQVLKSIDYTKQYSDEIAKAIELLIENGMDPGARNAPVIFLKGLTNSSFAMNINGISVIPGNLIERKPAGVSMVNWIAAGIAHEVSHTFHSYNPYNLNNNRSISPIESEKEGFYWTQWAASIIDGDASMAAQVQKNIAEGIEQLVKDSVKVKEIFDTDSFAELYYSGIDTDDGKVIYSLFNRVNGGDTLEVAYETESKTLSLYENSVDNKTVVEEIINKIINMPKQKINDIAGTSFQQGDRITFSILQEQESGTLVIKFLDSDKVFLVSLNSKGEPGFVEAKQKQSSSVQQLEQMGGIDLTDIKLKTEQELYIQEHIKTPPNFQFKNGLSYDIVTLNNDANPDNFIKLINDL